MTREEKEQRLQHLVDRFIKRMHDAEGSLGPKPSLDLVAVSPESPVALCVARRHAVLCEAGVQVRVIFANPAPDEALARWMAASACVRWIKDLRLLEAHEQLVLGDNTMWSGDAMRRQPGKIDLFEMTHEGDAAAVRQGLRSFERLLSAALTIQPRRITASLAAQPKEPAPQAQPAGSEVPPAGGLTPPTPRLFTRH